jgi:hypothetical protein
MMVAHHMAGRFGLSRYDFEAGSPIGNKKVIVTPNPLPFLLETAIIYCYRLPAYNYFDQTIKETVNRSAI